ncbi:MAG: hypothetical protein KKB50_05085 [Planctomycetes bacterium]|nr:hypothetical protein [Planctomycetota bacterium]
MTPAHRTAAARDWWRLLPLLTLLTALAPLPTTSLCYADEEVVTILADFEDASVAATIGDVQGVSAADCAARLQLNPPAIGYSCLGVNIGATVPRVSVACDLRFRVPTRFEQAERVATFCYIDHDALELTFRIRDALGQVFETTTHTVAQRIRWVRVAAELSPRQLRRIQGSAPLAWPIEIQGYRITTTRIGRQTVYLDDLQVEHRVAPVDMIRGHFVFGEPTRMYRPGSWVNVQVVLENRSRKRTIRPSVELAWTRADGSVLQTQRSSVNLPASGEEGYRSQQALDFAQPLERPGLYRLVARVRAADWRAPNVFETAIAVTPNNRHLPRGRSTFFGLRTNLLREPRTDQLLEIALARDLGVHLLAIDMPWRLIETKPDHYDFEPLDPLIEAITSRNMAALVTLTEPPAWLTGTPQAFAERRTKLLAALARRYNERVSYYQLAEDTLPEAAPADRNAALETLQQHLRTLSASVSLIAPAHRVSATDDATAAPLTAVPQAQYLQSFATSGDAAIALAALDAFAQARGFTWQRSDWWEHSAEPLVGAGHFYEAEAVLRHYVHAAASGAGSVIWFDLRDDDNDPANPGAFRGLVRRDFSPKTPLLGYATTVGMLTGLRYAGPVLGTPREFESALFIGGDRQVAVVLPRQNELLPAVLAPIQGVPGVLTALDFERRPQPLLRSDAPPLLPTPTRPVFITLTLENAQPEPQLALARPWLRAPARVFCGTDTEFTLEIDAPQPLRRSYLQLQLPPHSPVQSSFSARSLSAAAGETLQHVIRLTSPPGAEFDQTQLDLRLSLEGRALSIPIEVRPLSMVQPFAPGTEITDGTYRLGKLAADTEGEPSATATVFAAYEPSKLHLALAVMDDRHVAFRSESVERSRGDEFLCGLAVPGQAGRTAARIVPTSSGATLDPVYGTPPQALRGWRCTTNEAQTGQPHVYRLTILARLLGQKSLTAGTRVLVSVIYRDDDDNGLPATLLNWGGGVDGGRSTEDYRCLELGAPSPP